jgi:integrase
LAPVRPLKILHLFLQLTFQQNLSSFDHPALLQPMLKTRHLAPAIGRVAIMHLTPHFGEKLLCDITAKAVEAYQQARLREGAQGRTVNIEVQALRQILKANKCWHHLEGEIHSLKERKGIGRALTPEEESQLLTSCAKADSVCYTATVLALNTTMCKDEIRNLRWSQVALFPGVLTVRKGKTSARTGRIIPLNPSARKALADWGNQFPSYKPEHYVFPWCEYRHVDPTKPTKGWRTATRAVECPKCGLLQRPTGPCKDPECKTDMHDVKSPPAGLRFHDLRHRAITKLAESQASDQTIMAIAGHVSRQMLEHYSHIHMAAKPPPWTVSLRLCQLCRPPEKWPILGEMCTKMITKSGVTKTTGAVSW